MKIGVYVCHCGSNIAGVVDIESFCKWKIEEVLTAFGPKRNINFDSCFDYREIIVDQKTLGHIITNLLSNAIKYSSENTDIDFNLKYQPDNIAVFTIEDKGIGINKDDLMKIYEPFNRGANVTGISGTGLGMSIVKHCIDLHKGEIKIESNINKGTKVTVEIPFEIP